MSRNKIDFINDLLSSDKISVDEKIKVLELTKGELKGFGEESAAFDSRIKSIEERLQNIMLPKQIKLKKAKGKKHSPKTMVNFLYKFSIDEKFKWFTHNPEGLITDFDYHAYCDSAEKELKKITGWDINNRTYYNVRNFISEGEDKSGTTLYGGGKILCSWKDVQQWCEVNPNIHPYTAQLNGELFKKYINDFKENIEFRTDNPDLTFNIQLKKIIRKVLGVDFNPKFTANFSDIGQAMRIYCDVVQLKNGIEQILGWISLNKSKSNEVEFDLKSLKEYYQLEIVHKNGYISASPEDNKWTGLSGDFDKTRKMLFAVADWEMVAVFCYEGKVEKYKLTCLDSNTTLSSDKLSQIKMELIPNNIQEVTHYLKLYKTTDL